MIATGLATRAAPTAWPAPVARWGGDTLWASCAFLAFALWWPAAKTTALGTAALALATTVEFSQLYHATWIDAVRGTRVGALLLGRGFVWSDLLCYAAGTLLAMLLDWLVLLRAPLLRAPPSEPTK